MSKRRNIKKRKLFFALSIFVASLVLILVFGGTYAAYTSVQTVKRVVSTVPRSDILFSSNYLDFYAQSQMNVEAYNFTRVDVHQNGENSSVYITICNYAQGNTTKWAKQNINYTWEATLVDASTYEPIQSDATYTISTEHGEEVVSGADILASTVYKVIYNEQTSSFSNGSCLLNNQVLTSDKANRNVYEIRLDPNYFSLCKVKVEAKATEQSPLYSGSGLGGGITTALYQSALASDWSGSFVDAENGYSNPAELSGFNYEISGSGKGYYLLSWDSEKLDISPIFLENNKANILNEHKLYDENHVLKSIIFQVNQEEKEMYHLQFYRNAIPSTGENWNQIEGYVIHSDFYETLEEAIANEN